MPLSVRGLALQTGANRETIAKAIHELRIQPLKISKGVAHYDFYEIHDLLREVSDIYRERWDRKLSKAFADAAKMGITEIGIEE